MEKRIITWQTDGHIYSRGFIFGNYGWSAAAYMKLIDAARKDFPHLQLEHIEIGKVRESPYMKHFAFVEFPLSACTAHAGYAAWDRFDFS